MNSFQLALLSYCFVNGDINRTLKGYDDCGNVCGALNNRHESNLEKLCGQFVSKMSHED